jgi:hypothetical protein
VRRSAKWNGWDCKQWRMMRTTTEKKLNVTISLRKTLMVYIWNVEITG